VLSAELFAGTLSTAMPHESGNSWVAYRFDFGFSGRLTLGAKTEIGLNLILLTFSRDNISGNISGSGISGRLRHHRILGEAGLLARHDRAAGVFTDLRGNIPMQGTFAVRYLFPKGRNVGISSDVLFGTFHQDAYRYPQIWSLKLVYGIYF
jgi:hypothetical protein